jgi:hypothetical protein
VTQDITTVATQGWFSSTGTIALSTIATFGWFGLLIDDGTDGPDVPTPPVVGVPADPRLRIYHVAYTNDYDPEQSWLISTKENPRAP